MTHAMIFQPATNADFEYIFNLCEVTMRAYVELDLGDCFEEIARPTISALIENELFQLVSIGDVRVGAVAIKEFEAHYQFEELYVEPSQQNCGIGTAIAQRIIAQACTRGKPIRLHVLSSNPAVAFWSTLARSKKLITAKAVFSDRQLLAHRH
jgi:GNAT superfamily N-acetyltransferase